MDITAILTVRNEHPYLGNCLRYLIDNGLPFVIIDNDSTDGTVELLSKEPFRNHLVEYVQHPYCGFFDWKALMQASEAAAARCQSEWAILVSADEIIHSFHEGESLSEAIRRIAATGADAIDCNEFVFLPIEVDYLIDTPTGQSMCNYYFFEPFKPRSMRARRRELAVSHVDTGGHLFQGMNFHLANETLAQRHYIFRNQYHAYEKYANRVFSPEELSKGWHSNRHNQDPKRFIFPTQDKLLRLDTPYSRKLDRSTPKKLHYWQW